jgi:hypothetical protein
MTADVPSRRVASGGDGAARGATNLSAGFIVLKSSGRIDEAEALRFLGDLSVGTETVLTCWPGKYGQELVDGCLGSWISFDPSSSYYWGSQQSLLSAAVAGARS